MRPNEIALGRFQIQKKTGAGAVGTVYRALDMTSGHPVAIKIMVGPSETESERFSREASALAALDHPGVVRYVAHGKEGDRLFLVMEWLEGEDLATLLKRQRLSVEDSVELTRQVAAALATAHQHGILHRDIKPRNLFLVGSSKQAPSIEHVKVLDFGIARFNRDGRSVTLTGAMLGTPGYMAPEQAQGSKAIDVRADLYSLGCVLYRCLTGRPAFEGDSVVSVLAKTILDVPTPPREVNKRIPRELDKLVMRLMSKDALDRPPDAGMLISELGLLSALRVKDKSDSLRPTTAGLTRSERRVVCILLAGIVSAVTTGDRSEARAPSEDRYKDPLHQLIESHGGKLAELASGCLLVTLSGSISAPDQAAVAARCALGLRALLGDVSVVLATGTQDLHDTGEEPRVGALIDRGAALLAHTQGIGVRIDDATAGLLDVRFDIRGDRDGLYIVKERPVVQASRTLLGKPYPCVGRTKELDYLSAIYDECVSESVAQAVLITGEPGRGKSRIRQEFIQQLRTAKPKPLVLTGRGESLSAGSAFGVLAPAIRRAAGIVDDDTAELMRLRLRARVARHLQDEAEIDQVAHFLGEMVNVAFPAESSEKLRAARRDPQLMGDFITQAVQSFLKAEAGAGPVILVLEDLHWGDLPTVRVVDATLRHLANMPLLVLALARPEVHGHFPGLWEERQLAEVRLSPLTKRASKELVRAVLGDTVEGQTIAEIVERSGGNPFYLEELVRAVARGEAGATLPPTVLAMVQARLDGLGPEPKRVLRAASIFGQSFWQGGVVALLGGDIGQREIVKCLEDLVARELISRRATATLGDEPTFAFRHALLRDAAYAMLTADDLELGHRLAGDWLTRVGERDPMVLAEHFDRGGAGAQAVIWYRRAAAQALEGDDVAAAILRSERGLACAPDGEDRGMLALIGAEAMKWRGELETALPRAEEAIEYLEYGSVPWFRAVGEALGICAQRGDLHRAARWVEEACAITTAEDLANAQLMCLCRGAGAFLTYGQLEEAAELVRQIEYIADAAEALEPLAAARVGQLRAARLFHAGLPAHTAYEEALLRFEEASDLRNATLMRINVGVAYAELGAYTKAEPMFRTAKGAAEQLGLANVAAWALCHLGNIELRRGHLEACQDMFAQCLAVALKQQHVRLEVAARLYLARLSLSRRRFAEADKLARTAIERAQGMPLLRIAGLVTRAHILLTQSREIRSRGQTSAHDVEARTLTTAAMQLLEARSGAEGEAYARLVHAEAIEAGGDWDGGAKAIKAARDRLFGRANRIAEEELRKSFLEDVWENARTVQLAAAWGG